MSEQEIHVSRKAFDGTCTFCGGPAEKRRLSTTALCERKGAIRNTFVTMWTLEITCSEHRYLALDYESEVVDPCEE